MVRFTRCVHGDDMCSISLDKAYQLLRVLSRESLGLSVYAARLIFVSAYIIASLYGLVWDIVIDWGLMPDPDNFVRFVLFCETIYSDMTQ